MSATPQPLAEPLDIAPSTSTESTTLVLIDEPSTVAELIAWGEENPIRWFIPDIILEDGVHILHGLEECFKTTLMLQMHEALTRGGEFLHRRVDGGLRTGIAELEMKQRPFARRLKNFWPENQPEIKLLPDKLRAQVLSGRLAKDRVGIIADWATSNNLDFVSIDSLSKLFPPGTDISRQDFASDVFSQIQKLPTVMILVHDRKPPHDAKPAQNSGNAEIAGSGRMSQDPDAVFQMTREDKRAPVAVFSWGKARECDKSEPIELYFDKKDFRLVPDHPFLHLLPRTQPELIVEAECRYGWKDRKANEYIAKLKELKHEDGTPAIREEQFGHMKRLHRVENAEALGVP
jgi:hypothetical protein